MDRMSIFAGLLSPEPYSPDSQWRRIVGLNPNPFNGGAESPSILSKERDTGYLPRCRDEDIAGKALCNRQSLPEKPVLKASA